MRKLEFDNNCYFKPIKLKLSDLELVAINITTEFLSIDSEYQLFRNLKGTYLFDKIERSVYNKRKRKLFNWMEEIRKKLASKFNEFENYFVVDSMPLEVCKLSRATRSKICKEIEQYLIEGIVLLKKVIFMVINFMQFVLFLEFFKALI